MNQAGTTMFSSGEELGNLVLSSDLLHYSWAAILEAYKDTTGTANPNDPTTFPISIKYRVDRQQSPHGTTIVAFVSSPPCAAQHFERDGRDLVSSPTLFDFVRTEVNPSFSIHRAALELFASHHNGLSDLKMQCCNISPLIVTGHSIGGSIASLFTLWLLESLSPKDASKHPLCITFGSPLIGDNGFQQAISERPTWNSSFLHVASNQDPIPKLFASPHASVYKPFGTFLLCSESGCACFEEPESVLDLMVAISSDGGPNEGLLYGHVLERLKRGAIYQGISELGIRNGSPLRTGIVIQIKAIKVGRTQQRHESGDINSLVTKVEKRAEDLVACRRNVFEPKKKLNDMKINMMYLEWYKKNSESHGGYYYAFRHIPSKSREEIVKRKNILKQYWDKKVDEAEKMPQKEGTFLRIGFLYAATNYRRMIEPLDIAEFYRKGKKDYLAERSKRYKLLEQWVKDDKQEGRQSNANERESACSLTEDSCFWAQVEEAIILCNSLKDGGTSPEDKESSKKKLDRFENYVMDLIKNYAVSTEIFFDQSSFMKWWADYENITGNSSHSSLSDFMRNRKYNQYV